MGGFLWFCVLALPCLIWVTECKPGDTSCDWRYYQHYETKGCTPELGPGGCPVRFHCKPLQPQDRKECQYKGRKYQCKEHIENMGPCDQCQCSNDGSTEDAFISCAVVDCPDDIQPRNSSCYMGHSIDVCCPTEICPSSEVGSHNRCEYSGKSYRLGEFIPIEHPCKSCICTKDWTGPEGPGCSNYECIMGQYSREIRDGCIPIYHEKACCPVDVKCGDIYGSATVTSPTDKDNLCFHKGNYYEIGSSVHIEGDKYGCNSCTCNVPPDFTCVQKACQPPPKPDCKIVFGHCCPEYECP